MHAMRDVKPGDLVKKKSDNTIHHVMTNDPGACQIRVAGAIQMAGWDDFEQYTPEPELSELAAAEKRVEAAAAAGEKADEAVEAAYVASDAARTEYNSACDALHELRAKAQDERAAAEKAAAEAVIPPPAVQTEPELPKGAA